MNVLVTGGAGFLGQKLVPELIKKGHDVTLLLRNPEKKPSGVNYLKGDITHPYLCRDKPFDRVYHMAALLDLSRKPRKKIMETNYQGTVNVINYCKRNKIRELFYVSTAYAHGERNPYEISKSWADEAVRNSWLDTWVFKPSIIVSDTPPVEGAYFQFIRLMAMVHRRAEIIRRKIEGTLRLPVLEPVFRIRGNPEAHLNLIPVEVVVKTMIEAERPGIFWVTNPNPPKLRELTEWIGELLMLRIKMERDFNMTPVEALFQKIAEPFLPYLQEIYLPSDIKEDVGINREYVHRGLNFLFR